MSTKSSGPQRCRLILQQCLAIQLSKAGNTPEDFWMYDSGYMIFQVSQFLCLSSSLHHEYQMEPKKLVSVNEQNAVYRTMTL